MTQVCLKYFYIILFNQ